MREILPEQIVAKMVAANSWWIEATADNTSSIPFSTLRYRRYFDVFKSLAISREPTRALLLMGPRRVGKTVLVFHLIRWLIERGHNSRQLFYLDLQQPLYNGLGLEELVDLAIRASNAEDDGNIVICFDEIQYMRNWEVHLKSLVDSRPNIKFIGTGSAASALRKKSEESGAGRFTDFFLPPLTFYEYLDLKHQKKLVTIYRSKTNTRIATTDIAAVNTHFMDYLNYGGYPEAAFSEVIQSDLSRYIRSDIVDKVLLKDLPSLYGIHDIQELNNLFTSLAYNTANEVSLEGLSKKSGVAKNTIKKYIEYLQSAFLIRVVHRIDNSARRFKRAVTFKVYLTNPSIRSALFSPISPDDQEMGDLVETAVFAQWFHSLTAELNYARWNEGEVDIVYLDRAQRPAWAVEVKWSDRYEKDPRELESLIEFCDKNPGCHASVTTRTAQSKKKVGKLDIAFIPTSLYCYMLGYNIIKNHRRAFDVT